MGSTARISQLGLSIGLPTGWDGGIYRRQALPDETTQPVLHASTVPLPPVRGDFGGGAVEELGVDDVFIALLEYDPADAGKAMYRATGGVPGVTPDLFSPVALQRLIAPQAGCQQFFTVARPGLLPLRGHRQLRQPLPAGRGGQLGAVRTPDPTGRRPMTGGWTGPYLVVCGLLAVAGAAKAWSPDTTARALRAAGLPSDRRLVRVAGGLEAVIAVAALLTGLPVLAGVVAASYLAFSAFIVVALVRGTPISSCGCFGKPDTPPSRLHVAINLGAAIVATAVATGPARSLPRALAHQPLAGLPLLVLAGAAGYLAYLVFLFPFGGSR